MEFVLSLQNKVKQHVVHKSVGGFNNIMKQVSALALLFLCTASLSAANIFSETFTASNGTSSGNQWYLDMTGCSVSGADYFHVVSNRLEARDTDCDATFYTYPIDISAYRNVAISIDATESGSLGNSDRIQFLYSINGGPFQHFSNNGDVSNDFSSMTASQSGLNGQLLVIKIIAYNDSGNDYYRVDNIEVTGTEKDNFVLTLNKTNGTCSTPGSIDLTVTPGSASAGGTSPVGTSSGCTVTLSGSGSHTLTSGQVGCITGSFNGSVTINGGTLINAGSASFSSFNFWSGTFYNNGTMTVSNMQFYSGRSFYNYGTVNNTGTFTAGGEFHNYGPLTTGHFNTSSGAKVYNTSDLYCSGNLTNNNATLFNSGTITAAGNITNNGGSNIINTGVITGNSLTNNAPINNNGSINVGSYTTINGSGSLTMNSGSSLVTNSITLNGSITQSGGPACANIAVSGNTTINGGGSMSGNVHLCDANGVETNWSSNYSGGASLNCNCSGLGYTYAWSNGATTQDISNLTAGTYTVTVTGPNGTTLTASTTITSTGAVAGDPAVFGSNVWNVYAWNAGNSSGGNGAWSSNYSGYYVINSLNFDTRTGQTYSTAQSWSDGGSPSNAAGYQGCTVGNDNHSYAFKRQGFPCGNYVINLPNHDDRVQLYVDGTLQYDNSGCCARRNNIWSGFLGASSTIELRISEGSGGSHGSIELEMQSSVTVASSTGASRCSNGTVTLQASASADAVIDWYAAASGGSVLGGGSGTSNYTTPSLSNTTVFYAEARHLATGCVSSARTAVTATINSATGASISGTNTICGGGSSTFTATGGGTYAWSTGATTAAITVSTAGTYTVTVTSGGCTSTASRTLTVGTGVTASISGTNTICNGASSTFTASGGGTFAWSTGATTAAISVSTSGTYTVTVTNASGCTANASRTLTVNTPPTVSISGTNINCFGQSTGAATLTVSGGTAPFTYNWGSGVTSQNRTGLTPGSYTVTVTTAAGCTASASVTIAQPASALSATTSATPVTCGFCTNGSATVSASGGTSPYTYAWSGGGTSSSITNRAAGTYTVTVTDNKGCTVTRSATITLPLQINIAGASACTAGSGSATASGTGGTAPYTFVWSNGATTATITNLTSGTYFVTGTDANGTTATQSVVISNVSIAAALSPASATICAGESVQLNASGANTYTWSPSAGLSDPNIANPIATPTSSTTYTLVVGATSGELVTNGNFESGNTGFTSAYGAVSAPGNGNKLHPEGLYAVDTNANNYHGNFFGKGHGGSGRFMIINGATLTGQTIWSQTVNVTPNTNYNFSTWITSVNATSPAELRFEINDVLLGPVIAAPGSLHTWVPFNTTWNSGSATSAVISIVNENAAAGGNDYGLDDISFTTVCYSNQGSIPITVKALPTAEAGSNVNLCTGASTTLTASGAGSGGTYAWSSGAITASTSVSPASSTVYTVTATNSVGCSSTDSVSVTVNSTPSVSISGTNVNCYGATTGSATTTVTGGTAPYSYNWGGGITTENRTGIPAGTYTVTVTSNGCTASASVTITQPVSGLNLSATSAMPSSSGDSDGRVDLSVAGGTAPYSYSWSNGASTQDLSAVTSGNYTVTVTDANNCTATYMATVPANVGPCVCIASGNWSNPSTWSGNCSGGGGKYAGYLDDIELKGFKVVVDSTHTVKSLVLKESTSDTTRLSFTNTNTLDILEDFSITTTATGKNVEIDIDGSAEMTVEGDFKINHGFGLDVIINLNANNGNDAKLTVLGNLDMTLETSARDLLITANAANDTINVYGSVLYKNNSTNSGDDIFITMASSSLLRVGGDVNFNGVRNQNMDLILNNSSKLELGGSIVRKASPSKFGRIVMNSSSTLIFNGSDQQIWEGNTGNTDNNTYRNVIIRNTSNVSPQVLLNGDVTVATRITFEDGNVGTGNDMLIVTSNSANSVTGHSAQSYVVGTLRRYIASNNAAYDFPLGYGEPNQYYWARIKNNYMVGPTYLTATFGEIPTNQRNASILVTDNDLTYTELNQAGIWTIDPNTQPLLGSYTIEVGTENFPGLMDNMFRIIKRPSRGNIQAWSNGNGLLNALGAVDRLVGNGLTTLAGLTSFSDFGIAQGNGSSLPIDLVSFSARPDGERVRLDWTVSMEINNDYFTIERSLDGVDFEPVVEVEGAGNHSEEKKYVAYDDAPYKGLSYYRLRQTDFDGVTKAYDMVSVTITSTASTHFDIVPNPNKGSFTIHMDTPFDKMNVSVLNAMGQMVYYNELLGTTGKTKTPLDLGNILASGMYFVKIDSGTNTYIKQMAIE